MKLKFVIGLLSMATGCVLSAQALIDCNFDQLPEGWKSSGGQTQEEDDSFAEKFVRKGIQPPTALVCTSDRLARLAMHYLHRHGYRIPEDISITGFDDHEICRLLDPPLSAIHVDYFQMGKTAAEMLLEMLDDFSLRHCQKLFECDLIVRESIGPAPKHPVRSLNI